MTGELIEHKTNGSFKAPSKSPFTYHFTIRRWSLTQARVHATLCAYLLDTVGQRYFSTFCLHLTSYFIVANPEDPKYVLDAFSTLSKCFVTHRYSPDRTCDRPIPHSPVSGSSQESFSPALHSRDCINVCVSLHACVCVSGCARVSMR